MQHIKMQDVPLDERPYDKCLSMGVSALTDVELLAICLRTGTTSQNVIELARLVLGLSENGGLFGLTQKSMKDYMQLKGIGKVKAVQLQCIGEIAKRIATSRSIEMISYNHPETIAQLYYTDLSLSPVEQVWLTSFDTKNHLLGRNMLSQGTVNSSIISPREIFLQAIKHQAVSVVLVHNHPSGDPKPSKEDLMITKRVQLAGEMIGIQLLDHIIIGNQTYFSMKEQGYIK